jgi:hypothetical protein
MTNEPRKLGLTPIDVKQPDEHDRLFWSVTSIIGVLEKPGLLYWAAEEAAKAAVSSARSLPARVEEEGEEAVVKWLRDARFRRPKDRLSATSLGSVAHAACEEYALTGTRPDRDHLEQLVNAEAGHGFTGTTAETDVIDLMLDRFDGWLQRFTPQYQAPEVVVYDTRYGYAGQSDAFLTVDGFRAIVDYKSSREPRDSRGKPKTPYPEVALQLAAYRHAEFAAVWRPRRTEKMRRRYYALSPEEEQLAVPVPEVDGGLVIHLTTEACEAYPVDCGSDRHTDFLYIQEAFRANQNLKTALGPPLEAPTLAEVPA